MHTTKITLDLLFEYQCTSGKFIRLPNRIETFFCPNWNALLAGSLEHAGVFSFQHIAAVLNDTRDGRD